MNVITGKNSIKAALIAQKKINKIVLDKTKKNTDIMYISTLADKCGITVEYASASKLDALAEYTNHQGIIAVVEPIEYVDVKDILQIAKEKGEPPFVVVLDHIEDPHNLGAILRTAEAAGVHGVIIPNKRAAAVTRAVYKTSSGAVFYVPIARVPNIANTIDVLKKSGLWVYCMDTSGTSMYNENMVGPIAVVIGSEGFGISDLVRKKCDFIISIPMYGHLTSLNASVSAGVVIYEIIRQRRNNEQ